MPRPNDITIDRLGVICCALLEDGKTYCHARLPVGSKARYYNSKCIIGLEGCHPKLSREESQRRWQAKKNKQKEFLQKRDAEKGERGKSFSEKEWGEDEETSAQKPDLDTPFDELKDAL